MRYPTKTSTKKFCDTIAASIARYGKYRYWASKRKGLSPEFRATRLWRGIKKGPLWRFSAYFPLFGPQKNLRETLVTSDTRVRLVKGLPSLRLYSVFSSPDLLMKRVKLHPYIKRAWVVRGISEFIQDPLPLKLKIALHASRRLIQSSPFQKTVETQGEERFSKTVFVCVFSLTKTTNVFLKFSVLRAGILK